VLGSTGNVYCVSLARIPTCTCPDFLKQRDLCKHILFVTLKVVGLPADHPLAFQKSYLQEELDGLLARLRARSVGTGGGDGVTANAAVRQRYASLKNGDGNENGEEGKRQQEQGEEDGASNSRRKPIAEDGSDDCPICFDSLVMQPPQQANNRSNIGNAFIVYCRGTCGTNFHRDCIRKWTGQQQSRRSGGGGGTCPSCRQPWVGDDDDGDRSGGGGHRSVAASLSPGTSAAMGTIREGYVNLGQYQGQPSTRDTSTYRTGYRRYWR